MHNQTVIPVKRKGLFLFGSIYPRVTGGMEIFNYYLVLNFLKHHPDRILYASLNGIEGFDSSHIPLRLFRPMRLFMPLQLLWILIRKRKEIKFVYTCFSRESWVITYLSALLFTLFRVPYIVTIHIGGQPAYKFFKPLQYYFTQAHEVVGVSQSICADYAKFRKGKPILFIPPIIPFSVSTLGRAHLRATYGFQKADRIILFAGSLKPMKHPEKGLMALQAIGAERAQQLQLKLLMAGAGEMQPHLEQYVKAHGLEAMVRFAGLVSREEMANLYALSDYYLISSDYEGMSISLLEALYNKLPVIGSRVDGIRNFLTDRDSGLLYPVHDHHALADCLLQLVNDNALASRIGHNGYALYCRHFNYEQVLRDYSKLFNSVKN